MIDLSMTVKDIEPGRKKKKVKETYAYCQRDRNDFVKRWNEVVKRLKSSGKDLGKIVIVSDEREGRPIKAAERGK